MATITPWVRRVVPSRSLLSKVAFPVTAVPLWSRQENGRCLSDDAGAKTSQSKPSAKAITISRAMKAYISRTKAHNDMMQAEVADYEIGKRHLANIMGEDPDNFTQQDVDRAIEYLLPSGLFDKKARPMMRNPYEIFPKRKAAQFGLDGRPYHWLYFTTLPNYYNLLYDIVWKLEGLKETEDTLRAQNKLSEEIESNRINLSSSEWISESVFKDRLVEKIQTKEYQHFVVLMERLASHPLAFKEEEFIMNYRQQLGLQSVSMQPPPIEVDSDGRAFATATGKRKRCTATVQVYKPGTGKLSINGKDLSFFTNLLHRETLLLPLMITKLIGEVDVVAVVEDSTGPSAQAGAIRLAMSQALQTFVDDETREKLRLAGLLTPDPRIKERKKPGQEKARKKFTWKKR